jgi:GNAT superfamily N-acetyltransferase
MIWAMYVAPHAQGHGIGPALLERVIAEARGWIGVEKLTLTVVERAQVDQVPHDDWAWCFPAAMRFARSKALPRS